MGKALSDSEIRRFHDQGYLSPLRAVSVAEAGELRRKLEEYEAEIGASALNTLHMKSHLYFSWLWDLSRSPAITGPLEDLMGPDILVWASRLWIKDPHDGKFVTWHQDMAYFGLDPQELLSVWIALTDATPANGSMRFIPGSHRAPMRHIETHDPDNLLSRGQVVPDVDESRAVDLVLKAGEFSIHHGNLLHSSEPNESDDRRIGFSLMVMPAHCRSTIGRRPATLLHGRDRFGNWDLDPMPTQDRDPVIWNLMNKANAHYRNPEIQQQADGVE